MFGVYGDRAGPSPSEELQPRLAVASTTKIEESVFSAASLLAWCVCVFFFSFNFKNENFVLLKFEGVDVRI